MHATDLASLMIQIPMVHEYTSEGTHGSCPIEVEVILHTVNAERFGDEGEKS